MPRRSYAQYDAAARSLDVVGERWTLLIVRELAFGPRRYTDLHADLPGISTDVLAARLKELEADGVVERRTFAPSAPVRVYDLSTDALRHHWYLLPLAELLRQAMRGVDGVVELRVESSSCRLRFESWRASVVQDEAPEAVVTVSQKVADELLAGRLAWAGAVADGQVVVDGSSAVATRLSVGGAA